MLRTGIHPSLSQALATAAIALVSLPALADPPNYPRPFHHRHAAIETVRAGPAPLDDRQDGAESSSQLRRRVVDYRSGEAPGTIIVDTANTYLYLVLAGGRAIRYGIGVGRKGFTWSGVSAVDRKSEWPDWVPPAAMLERQPYLPRFMAGGPGNPLGARALYIGGTVYRIHGTNDPSTIGRRVSSGCFRMLNDDVVDLYARVNVGTRVVVLPTRPAHPPSVPPQDRTNPRPAPILTADSGRAPRLH